MTSVFTESDRARFRAKYRVDEDTGCWEWTGAKQHKGYGRFLFGGRNSYAPRISYAMFIGPLGEGLMPDHLCRNPGCVNPEHLEAVTNRENVLRGFAARLPRTHCKRGHEQTAANTYGGEDGYSRCRLCQRIRNLAGQRRRRAELSHP